jgi:hypothetical protein
MRWLVILAVTLLLVTMAGSPAHAMGGWYVVTYSGQAVMGPFSLLDDCSREAERLSREYYNVSSVCRYYS